MTLNDFKSIAGRPAAWASARCRCGWAWTAPRALACCDDGRAAGRRDRAAASPGARPGTRAAVGALLAGAGRADGAGSCARPGRSARLVYSGFGVPLFVLGMMVSAFALRSAAGGMKPRRRLRLVSASSAWAWCRPRWARSSCSTTSTLNRVMVVELALPALLPGAAGRAALRGADARGRAWATAPTSAAGARRGSSAAWRVLALGGIGAAPSPRPGWAATARPASLLAVAVVRADRPRRRRRRHVAAGAAGQARGRPRGARRRPPSSG
ncbi:MAG: hypothetical protein MZW92_69850 [Comamonadaceae bacterium]|nr:hypothetical protein [Comamonadaceae bacterium]